MPVSAPIDRELLEPCLLPWPESARTLPRPAYVDPDVFRWEQIDQEMSIVARRYLEGGVRPVRAAQRLGRSS